MHTEHHNVLAHAMMVLDTHGHDTRLTPRLMRVFLAVYGDGPAPAEGELVHTLELQRLDVNRAITTLEAMSLIRRLRDAETKRYRLYPSAAGERLYRALCCVPATAIQEVAA